MQSVRLVPVLLALSLAVPTAWSWSVSGSFEPDTPEDVVGDRIWEDADWSSNPGTRRVYFNAHPTDQNSGAVGPNPNVGATKSRYLPAGQLSFSAYLGFWKDCNKDGYIGMAESAMLDYNAALLTDTSVCAPNTYFNHHGWVSEFVPIGDVSPYANSASYPRILRDDEAKVWGDFGRPGREDEIHYDCVQIPFPRGSFDNTGGILVYADCQIGYNVAKTLTASDPTGTLGFDDPHHPERDCDSVLNQPLDTYGRDPCNPDDPGALESNTSRPMFTVYDCRSEPEKLYDVRDPTGAVPNSQQVGQEEVFFKNENGTLGVRLSDDPDGTWLQRDGVAPLAPSLGDADGSAYDGVQNAQNGAGGCDANPSGQGLSEGTLGADVTSTNPTDGKQSADFELGPQEVYYGIGGYAPSNMPHNAGVRPASNGHWDAGVTYLPPTYLGPTVRNSDLSPAGGIWFTFYAFVGANTTAAGGLLPPGASAIAVYGNEACNGETQGKHRGWDCDKDRWHGDVAPGQAYLLRDTDCYDGALVDGVPVYVSLALVDEKEGPCPTP